MLKILDLGTGTAACCWRCSASCRRRRRPGNRYPARRHGCRPRPMPEALGLGRPGALQDRRLGSGDRRAIRRHSVQSALYAGGGDRRIGARGRPLRSLAGALRAGSDGLDSYRRTRPQLPGLLAGEGRAFIELGFGQAAAATRLFETGGLEAVDCRSDLAGIPRCLVLEPAKKSWKSPCDRLG